MKNIYILICIIIILLFLIPSTIYSWGVINIGSYVSTKTPSAIFSEDFEGEDTVWDTDCGSCAADCDGYDTAGDYCDDEGTVKYAGSEALGIYGAAGAYVEEAITSSTELYIDTYWRGSAVTTTQFIALRNSAAGWSAVIIGSSSSGYLRVWRNNAAAYYTATTNQMSVDTFYHIRVYYKEETGSDDGVIKAWIDDTLVIDISNADTGDSNDVDIVRLAGCTTGNYSYHDNVNIYQGAP